MKPRKGTLTKQRAAFRDAMLAGFNPSEAYKMSFNAKGMSKKAISVEAQKLLKNKDIALAISLAVQSVAAVPTVLPAPTPHALMALSRRMEELSHAATLDPIDCFDDLNQLKGIREMPEHVRRCIAGFEVDPVSFITKVRFIDKVRAIMEYSKLAGDIPKEKPTEKRQGSRYDLSKLTDPEFKEHLRLRRKAMVEES